MFKRVILESPFRASSEHTEAEHVEYAQKCMLDCLKHSEAPFSSHLLYTQPNVLDDSNPEERKYGIEAGFAWRRVAHKTVFYVDYGYSEGMLQALKMCRDYNFDYEERRILAYTLKLSLTDYAYTPEGQFYIYALRSKDLPIQFTNIEDVRKVVKKLKRYSYYDISIGGHNRVDIYQNGRMVK